MSQSTKKGEIFCQNQLVHWRRALSLLGERQTYQVSQVWLPVNVFLEIYYVNIVIVIAFVPLQWRALKSRDKGEGLNKWGLLSLYFFKLHDCHSKRNLRRVFFDQFLVH